MLVTVPACLEILMFHAKTSEFAGKVRWVIFDEVHNLGGADGHVWERLLLSVSCPFLALSATIGCPESIQRWLNVAHREHHGVVRLIEHHQRYNELAYQSFSDIDGRVHSLNPLGLLDVLHIKNGWPPNARLLPEQCLGLYNSLRKNLTTSPGILEKLNDHVFISGGGGEGVKLGVTTDIIDSFQTHLKQFCVELANMPSDSVGLNALELVIKEARENASGIDRASTDWPEDKIKKKNAFLTATNGKKHPNTRHGAPCFGFSL